MSALATEVAPHSEDSRACRDRARAEVLRMAAALRIDSNDVAAWCRLGIALAALGQRTAALVALRHALSRDVGHAPSQLALGKLLFDCGQVEHALHCFDCARVDLFS
jgi:tetratricopeptide (TPR) repeat protein